MGTHKENKLERECHHCGTIYTIDFERYVAYYKFTLAHWRYCPVCGHDIYEKCGQASV